MGDGDGDGDRDGEEDGDGMGMEMGMVLNWTWPAVVVMAMTMLTADTLLLWVSVIVFGIYWSCQHQIFIRAEELRHQRGLANAITCEQAAQNVVIG